MVGPRRATPPPKASPSTVAAPVVRSWGRAAWQGPLFARFPTHPSHGFFAPSVFPRSVFPVVFYAAKRPFSAACGRCSCVWPVWCGVAVSGFCGPSGGLSSSFMGISFFLRFPAFCPASGFPLPVRPGSPVVLLAVQSVEKSSTFQPFTQLGVSLSRWKAWKKSVYFPTLPTVGRRRTVQSVENASISHPSHSKRKARGASLCHQYFFCCRCPRWWVAVACLALRLVCGWSRLLRRVWRASGGLFRGVQLVGSPAPGSRPGWWPALPAAALIISAAKRRGTRRARFPACYASLRLPAAFVLMIWLIFSACSRSISSANCRLYL